MLELAVTFNRSLDRLTAGEQALAKQVVVDYMTDPTRPGLSLHRVDRARDRRFWTIRSGLDLRIVVFKEGARSVFCYIGHHDDAYKWAEGRRFEVHPITGAAQIVELEEVVRKEIRVVSRDTMQPGLLAGETPEYLLSLGVPESFINLVRSVDEDGLLELLRHLPEEAQEALLELAAGNRPAAASVPATNRTADPFVHPDAQRRFWVVSDQEMLSQALQRPWAEWLVFLHPSQRAAVERSFNGAARVSGSAGTGKSVVAMHRAAHFARISEGGRVLLTTFSKTLAGRLSDGMDTLLGPASDARTRVEVAHLHAYAYAHVSRLERPEIADDRTIDRLIKEARGNLDGDFDVNFLRAEWDAVIDFWGVSSFDGYRDIQRIGRGAALTPAARKCLWDVFAKVRAGLASRKLHTFGDICDLLRRRIEADSARPFTDVIVDEAQDFGPREMRLVASLAPPGALFFAGDVGQRIFRWPFSWTAAGIDVRGRSLRGRLTSICRRAD
jgi:AAA domain